MPKVWRKARWLAGTEHLKYLERLSKGCSAKGWAGMRGMRMGIKSG
jgi:hypothetical protein